MGFAKPPGRGSTDAGNCDAKHRLISLRRELDISQETLARLLGVSTRTVSRWESGQAQPDDSLERMLERLSGIVGALKPMKSNKAIVQWLGNRVYALENSTPMELLTNDFSARALRLFAETGVFGA